MQNNKSDSTCCGGTKLIFSCSGAADTGHLSDLAARKLTTEGKGRMFCMAGIAGQVDSILNTTRAADKILAIDGCPVDCVRKTLELSGFKNFAHIRITDLGMEKGKSPVDDEKIKRIVANAEPCLA